MISIKSNLDEGKCSIYKRCFLKTSLEVMNREVNLEEHLRKKLKCAEKTSTAMNMQKSCWVSQTAEIKLGLKKVKNKNLVKIPISKNIHAQHINQTKLLVLSVACVGINRLNIAAILKK